MPYIVVLVVLPPIAYGGVTYFASRNSSSPSGTSAATESGENTPTPSATATTPPQETPIVTPTQAPEVDLTREVSVYNATSTSGLAGNGFERLTSAGFETVVKGDWAGADTTKSVVYYPSPEDITTAQLVASTLGVTNVEEDAEQAGEGANGQIVVVLAEDYEPTS